MDSKKLLILGSTGAIGQKTLQVVAEHRDLFSVCTLVANTNIEMLAAQAESFLPQNIAIFDQNRYSELKKMLAHLPQINVCAGWNDIADLLTAEYDVAIAAIMGIACLKPLIQAIPNTKVLGLANKESIICAGQILMDLAKVHNTHIVPVDSEHSAIYQILNKGHAGKISKVTLTASGGPFYNKALSELQNVKVSDAIAHPVWRMGAKISVDSATLMNKGLELIEAHYLFDLEPNKLDAVIHPQAIAHGFVEYTDGSILAQMAPPDMRTPISLALGYPERLDISGRKLNWHEMSQMQFFAPDYARFPCLKLAIEAMQSGQARCIALNIANEVAVALFLQEKLNFLKIPDFITDALNVDISSAVSNIEGVLELTSNLAEIYKKLPY